MSRTPYLLAALTPLLLLSGCPDDDEEAIEPPKPVPVETSDTGPQEGPQFAAPVVNPVYGQMSEKWADEVAKAGNWPRLVPKLIKNPTQGPALTNAFDPPSIESAKLALLVRYTPVADLKGQVVTNTEYALRKYAQKNNLDAGYFDATHPRAVGLLVLLDPSFLWEQRWLKIGNVWTNLREGLRRGAFHPDLAKAFLKAYHSARAGKWVEAIPQYTQAFLWLGTFNAEGDEAAKPLLKEVDRLCRQGEVVELESALQTWAAHYGSKDPKAPQGTEKKDYKDTKRPGEKGK